MYNFRTNQTIFYNEITVNVVKEAIETSKYWKENLKTRMGLLIIKTIETSEKYAPKW